MLDNRTFFPKDAVKRAYRLVLGREPESISAICYWQERATSEQDLIAGMIASQELSQMPPERQQRARASIDAGFR